MFVLSRVIALCLVLTFGCNFAFAENKIDINAAPLEDLTKIIHIGEKRAIELISLRPFYSLDELSKINGISKSRVEDIIAQGMAFTDRKKPEELVSKEEKAETNINEGTKIIINNEKPNKDIPIAISISLISAVLILSLKKLLK